MGRPDRFTRANTPSQQLNRLKLDVRPRSGRLAIPGRRPVTMAACVEEVAAVRDGLGLHPFHVLGHSGGRLARPRVRPPPPEGLAGGRSCQVTVVRVASSPVGALPFGRSREGAVWRCRAPTLMYATSPWVGHLASCRLRCHFLRRQTMIAHSEPVEAGETLSCASTAPATSWGTTAPTWRG